MVVEEALRAKALLIGNGPSILENPLGESIDTFQGIVVRFNEFVCSPATCTGTRTDMWIICRTSHSAVYKMHPEIGIKPKKVPKHIQYYEKETRFRSTGIGAMFWFLDQGYSVYLYGFDHFHPEKRLHYFDHDRGKMLCKEYTNGGRKQYHSHDQELVLEAINNGLPVRYFP